MIEYDSCHHKEAKRDFARVMYCGRTALEVSRDLDNPCVNCPDENACFNQFAGGENGHPVTTPPPITLEEFYDLSLPQLCKKYRVGNERIYKIIYQKYGVTSKTRPKTEGKNRP